MIHDSRVAVVGLGKLGLPLVATLAKHNNEVIGLDIDHEKLTNLSRNRISFHETGLQDTIKKNRNKLKFTDNFDAILKTKATIVLVNTPSVEGKFSNVFVEAALISIGKALQNWKESYPYTVIISSTVMPGSTKDSFIPILERESGKVLNKDFNVCYIPDLVALGSVIHDFENPDLVMIGASDDRAFSVAHSIWCSFIDANVVPIHKLSISEAEIAKISLNAYITMKISFANFIGNLCDEFNHEVNANKIAKIIGQDKRIAPAYFTPGLAFGGTCFPRDTWAFIEFAKMQGLNASHIEATQRINEAQRLRLLEKTIDLKKQKIAILGLGFKTNSPIIVESPAVNLIKDLLVSNNKYKIHVYDPFAMNEVEKELGDSVVYHYSAEAACNASECAVVATAHPEFRPLGYWAINKDYPILDCWKYLPNKDDAIPTNRQSGEWYQV